MLGLHMGLNFPIIKSLIDQEIFVQNSKGKKLLEIGKLKNSLTDSQKQYLWRRYKLPMDVSNGSADEIYRYFGFTEVITLDNSDFEGANLNHNLNIAPYESTKTLGTFEERFDLVIDGGTSEHVYSPITALTNYLFFTKKDGLLVQFLPVNNYIDHGLYQFSPTFFYSIDIKNLALKNLSFFEHGNRGNEGRYWDGLDPTFKEHIHGAWDGSAFANLFRFTHKNIVAVAIWKKNGTLDYKSLMSNSQQEVYRHQWNKEQVLLAKLITTKKQWLFRYIFQHDASWLSRIFVRVLLRGKFQS